MPSMFDRRKPRPDMSPMELKIMKTLIDGPRTEKYMVAKVGKLALAKAEKADIVSKRCDGKYVLPEHMLIDHRKSWNELTEVEIDYFIGLLLNKNVVIRPILPMLTTSPLVCVIRTTGSWFCPTIQWKIAKTLQDKHGIILTYDEESGYKGRTPMFSAKGSNACELICRLALAREEPYDINYHEATADWENNKDYPN